MENESTNELLKQLLAAVKENTEEVKGLRGELREAGASPDPDRPLDRPTAAEYLGVHPDTLYKWAAEEGRIRYYSLGNGPKAPMRFRRRDLDAFVNRGVIPTVEETRANRVA